MRRLSLFLALLAFIASAPGALAQDPPGLGFAFVPEPEGLRVTTLADDGPAGPAGLLAGDLVTTVSGKPMSGLERDAIAEWLTAVNNAGLPVFLDVQRDGTTRQVSITPAPYSREALAAKTEAEAVFDSLDAGTFVDLLGALGSVFDSSPELEAFREAMDRPPHNRTVERDGDDLVIASAICTVRVTISDEIVVTPSATTAAYFNVEGPGIESQCRDSDAYQPEDVNFDVDSRESRDAAVSALRALIRSWDDVAPAPSASADTGCIAGDCTDGTGTWRYESGTTYAGTWRGGKRHGRGTYTFTSGMTFVGDWVDGSRVSGRETYESGATYDGEYANDKRHGRGTYTFTSGNVYTGAWVEGTRTGYGSMAYTSGDTYAGNWREGKRDGLGTYTWAETGMTFTGTWADGARVQGRETFTDGRVYQGEYANDKRHGQGTMTYPDGRVETGTWREGTLVASASQPVASQPAAPPASAPRPTDPAPGSEEASGDVCVSGSCTDGTGTMRYASGQTLTGTFAGGQPIRGLLSMVGGDAYDGEFGTDGRFHGQGLYTFGPGEYEGHTFQGTFADGAPTSGTYTWANGQTYEGDWDGWSRTGRGLMSYTNGNKYIGDWRDGLRHGQGTFTFSGGGDFRGEWVDDERVQGQEYYTSGNVYEGAYADDKRHGIGVMRYASGDLYAGEWVAGDRVGIGTYTWADGKKYTGAWTDNVRNGTGTMTFPDGNRYEGDFANGQYHGQGVFTWANGQRYEGEFADDQRHGQGTQHYVDGRVFIGTWAEGKPVEGKLRRFGDAEARPVRNEDGTFVYTD
ncbi:MAG: PDZ domain-containing protein [Bacteroidota bacterium]